MTARNAHIFELQTARLRLRGLRTQDAATVARETANPRVAHFLNDVPDPYTTDMAHQWIVRRIERTAHGRGPTLAITPAAAAAAPLLGTVALRIHRRDQRAELGYWLAEHAWGQGLASEAAHALVAWGFTQGLHKIYARVMSDNPGSIRVLEKLGMVLEGHLRAHLRRGGTFVDVLEWSVLATEWATRREAGTAPAPSSGPHAVR